VAVLLKCGVEFLYEPDDVFCCSSYEDVSFEAIGCFECASQLYHHIESIELFWADWYAAFAADALPRKVFDFFLFGSLLCCCVELGYAKCFGIDWAGFEACSAFCACLELVFDFCLEVCLQCLL